MAQFQEVRFQQLDQVRILTTKNVKYLSAPTTDPVSPHGIWSVATIIPVADSYDLLLVRQNATIRIPVGDVLKIVSYDLNTVISPLGNLSNGQGKRKEG
jgi:hypothetical protein